MCRMVSGLSNHILYSGRLSNTCRSYVSFVQSVRELYCKVKAKAIPVQPLLWRSFQHLGTQWEEKTCRSKKHSEEMGAFIDGV